jgi:uncharacterized protein
MILESIVTTLAADGTPHIAPLGVHVHERGFVIAPFRPSRTLDNINATRCAVINACDDVRVFAGCLTGRRDWPLAASLHVKAPRLTHALAHQEVEVIHIENADSERPRFICSVKHQATHAPFRGFNRAQAAVVEGAILVSRLSMLSDDKIDAEWAYLQIAIDKTASDVEREAWGWLQDKLTTFRRDRAHKAKHD